MGIFGDDPVSQRDIGSDDEITAYTACHDLMIGFIRPLIHNDIFDLFCISDRDSFVGDDNRGDMESLYAS